jgi:hypothetical protein
MNKHVSTGTIEGGWTSSSTSVFGGLEQMDGSNELVHVERHHINRSADPRKVEEAVFAHIRAMRSLGRTTANTAQIARALSLSTREVDRAVARLHDRGVKLVSR